MQLWFWYWIALVTAPTSYLVLCWGLKGEQLDTKYWVDADMGGSHSILGIELRPTRAAPRYQVSNWGLHMQQLDTEYRIEAYMGSNSIPSNELRPTRGPIWYQASNLAPFQTQFDTWYQSHLCKNTNSIRSIKWRMNSSSFHLPFDTWYRVGVLTGIILTPTGYLVLNWVSRSNNSIPSIEFFSP